ncbi:MAG TPA: N-acetylmuramoyl-L-alanine amidase [Anaeromyxobacteraceae bacterium]|nr:N-acetylmuramoyl-L-alanine amidase [Anaeromyxobacteraceae bacterium]
MATPRRVALVALVLALVPSGAGARHPSARHAAGRSPEKGRPARSAAAAQPSRLDRSRAALAALKRNPAKRRYRHNWEKAIRDLERAARGPDTAPALLEAARARYALYRFSAVDSDREKALALASRAARAGSADAGTFAAAVRREAGDDEPRTRAQRPAREAAAPAPAAGARAVAPPPAPATPPAPPEDDESEPVLEEAVAEGSGEGRPEAPAPTPEEPARVSEVRSWSNADYTRVAVYLSRTLAFTKQELPGDREHPRRLALDLKPALLGGGAVDQRVGDALVRGVRAAQYSPDTVRVVLDLAGEDGYQLFTLEDPPRLIVDVGTREAQRDAIARLPRPAPPADGDEGEGGLRRPVRRVIVDAGHGGHDTGAIGPRGVREKDVTLSMAHRLARDLRAAGFEVVLTRSDDRYLRLEERTAIANMARGDLFISIHANAHPRRDQSGVETYFLNVTDDRYSRRLAARENGALEEEGGPGVQRILSDLNARASADASRRLALMVQKDVLARVRQSEGEVRDLGVKHALFYVLLGARMPAVLVETAFISNRAEERRLASPGYQQLVADGVTRAVCDFAGREYRVAAR